MDSIPQKACRGRHLELTEKRHDKNGRSMRFQSEVPSVAPTGLELVLSRRQCSQGHTNSPFPGCT
jgi:hypothetical protein